MAMSVTLEVVALHAADAQRAEAGGADRIELLGTLESGGLSPEPRLVAQVRAVTSVQIRPIVRLREGFGTDGGEVTRLRGLMASYAECGADGMVLGFVNGHSEVDLEVLGELLIEGGWPWTFHQAFDSCLEPDRAWRAVKRLPRLDQVLTSGSARGLEYGLDDLLARARADADAAALIMAGQGLAPEHVPWLIRAGVRAFQIGDAARPLGSYKAYVDSDLVHSWRTLLDDEARHARRASAANSCPPVAAAG